MLGYNFLAYLVKRWLISYTSFLLIYSKVFLREHNALKYYLQAHEGKQRHLRIKQQQLQCVNDNSE